jgi:hypothetical protein
MFSCGLDWLGAVSYATGERHAQPLQESDECNTKVNTGGAN